MPLVEHEIDGFVNHLAEVAIGGGKPIPRKLSEASTIIAGTKSTMLGLIELGMAWRQGSVGISVFGGHSG